MTDNTQLNHSERLPESFQALLEDDEEITFGSDFGTELTKDESSLLSFGGLSLADQDYGLPPPETFEIGTSFDEKHKIGPSQRVIHDRLSQENDLPNYLTHPERETLLQSFPEPVALNPLSQGVQTEIPTDYERNFNEQNVGHEIVQPGNTKVKPLYPEPKTPGRQSVQADQSEFQGGHQAEHPVGHQAEPLRSCQNDQNEHRGQAELITASHEPFTPPNKITSVPEPAKDDDLTEFYNKFSSLTVSVPPPETPQTLIYLSLLSYKHVFSRPWVNKKYISRIVERPQRLMACSLGIASAMTVLPQQFKLEAVTKRSSLFAPHVTRVHGKLFAQRLYDLCEQSPEKLSQGKLEVPEDWNYGDIYLAKETIAALEGVIGSVEEAVNTLFKRQSHDQVFVTIRPPGHHCHPCVPSGFCLINNVHIAIQYAKEHYGVTHACILDFDLHHGDGTQDLCWRLAGYKGDYPKDDPFEYVQQAELEAAKLHSASSSPSKRGRRKTESPQTATTIDPTIAQVKLAYFSLHDINSFPTEAGYATEANIKNASICLDAHNMYIWNVHLQPYSNEEDFENTYDQHYKILFEKAAKFLHRGKEEAARARVAFKPLVVISAGFDASEYENQGMQRHGASVPTSFFNRFTADSVKLARQYCKGKLLSLLEGGYSDAALSTGVFSHLTGLAMQPWQDQWGSEIVAKGYEKGCKLKWNAHSVNGADLEWLTKGIDLGRSLWPADVKAQVAFANSSAATTGRRLEKQQAFNPSLLATPSRVLRDRTKRTT